MATNEATTSKPADQKSGVKRPPMQRSPNFPVFSLKKAVDKAVVLHQENKRFPVHVGQALKLLGFESTKSGNALQCVSALKAFGLIEVEGGGNSKQVKVSDAGAQVVQGHPERQKLLQQMALKPALFQQIGSMQSDDTLPSDTVIRNELLFKLDFNESAVPTFIKSFRETMAFAGLPTGDNVLDRDKGQEIPKDSTAIRVGGPRVKIGNRVQWSPNGVEQFEEPREVLGLFDDEYARVEGSEGGVPISELTVVDTPLIQGPKPQSRVGLTPRLPPGLVEESFNLNEGSVTIRWPDTLSVEDVDDLDGILKVVLARKRRNAVKRAEESKK